MSEQLERCSEIEGWLLEPGPKGSSREWDDHLETCSGCREQVRIHQSLVAAFAEEDVPELSSSFEAGLERKIATARFEVRPLTGWRRIAMIAYGAAAAGVAGWALRNVPLPAIDLSAPWVPVVVFLSAPVTLLLAVAASRWLPGPAPKSLHRALAL